MADPTQNDLLQRRDELLALGKNISRDQVRELNDISRQLRNDYDYKYGQAPKYKKTSKGAKAKRGFVVSGKYGYGVATPGSYVSNEAQATGYEITPDEIPFSDRVAEEQKRLAAEKKAAEDAQRQSDRLRYEQVKNEIIVQNQKNAGLNNAQIVEYNVWGIEPMDPSIDPRTGKPYGTLEEFKPTAAQKYSMWQEQARDSDSTFKRIGAGLIDIPVGGVMAGKDIAVGTWQWATHPIKSTKATYSFVTSPDQWHELGANIGETINKRPGYAVGYAGVTIFGPKIVTKGAKKLVGLVEETAETTQAMARSKKAAVFREGRRISPMSNVQKSKQSRNQYVNPKRTVTANQIVERSGRAAADTRTLERISPGQVRLTKTRKTPRGENQVTAKTIADVNFKESSIVVSSDIKFGKGPARTARQGVGRRPASQVKTNTGLDLSNPKLGDNEYILIQRQSQKLTGKQFRRQARNAQNPNFNNPSNTPQALVPQSTKGSLAAESYRVEKRVANPRERIVKQTKARLRKVAQQRLADRRGQYQDSFIPDSFFGEVQSTRALVKAGARQVARQENLLEKQIKINPKRLPGTASSSELAPLYRSQGRYIKSNVEQRSPGLGEDVEIIVPKKAMRAESVRKARTSQIPKNAPGRMLRGMTRLSQSSLLRSQEKLDLSMKSKTQSKTKSALASKVKTATRQRQRQLPALVQTQVRAARIVQTEITNQRSRSLRTPNGRTPTSRQPEPFNQPRESAPPRRPPRRGREPARPREPPLRLFPRLPRDTPAPSKFEVFNVFTRKAGKIVKASARPLSRAQALKFGERLVGGSARASFKLKSAGFLSGISKDAALPLSRKFKTGKGGWFVEINKARIDTPGERSEIRRRSSWLSLANIKKKVKGSFWK